MTKAKREHQPGNVGAWIEWGLATKLCQLGLKTGSDWRVMLAVLLTSSRYGGRPALLSIALLAQMTGLAPRTVQAAVTRLKASGLIVRHGRYGSLSCTLRTQGLCDATQQKPDDARGQTGETRSADMLALPLIVFMFLLKILGLSPRPLRLHSPPGRSKPSAECWKKRVSS